MKQVTVKKVKIFSLGADESLEMLEERINNFLVSISNLNIDIKFSESISICSVQDEKATEWSVGVLVIYWI